MNLNEKNILTVTQNNQVFIYEGSIQYAEIEKRMHRSKGLNFRKEKSVHEAQDFLSFTSQLTFESS